MNTSTEPDTGVFGSLRRILDTALATVQNRVELFSVELREEKCRFIEAVVCAAMLAAFGSTALVLGTLAVVLYFWENGRLAVLGTLCLLYLIASAFIWRRLSRQLGQHQAFSATLAEIKKDRQC